MNPQYESWLCCGRYIRSAFCPNCGDKMPEPDPVKGDVGAAVSHGMKMLSKLSQNIQGMMNSADTQTRNAQRLENAAEAITSDTPIEDLRAIQDEFYSDLYSRVEKPDPQELYNRLHEAARLRMRSVESLRETVLNREADAKCLRVLLNHAQPGCLDSLSRKRG